MSTLWTVTITMAVLSGLLLISVSLYLNQLSEGAVHSSKMNNEVLKKSPLATETVANGNVADNHDNHLPLVINTWNVTKAAHGGF